MSENPILIAWERFGPYHHARARAAHGRKPIATLEISPVDNTYAWDQVDNSLPNHSVVYEHSLVGLPTTQLRKKLHSTLYEISPDAVMIPGWSERWALIILEWALINNVSAILMSASNAHDELRSVGYEWVKKRIVSLFSAGLVGGKMGKNYLLQLGMRPEVIFSGYDVVDNSHFENASSTRSNLVKAIIGDKPFFLTTARFVKKKNLDRLITAYAEYRRLAGSDYWRLVILGDGEQRPLLEDLCNELNLKEDVKLPGFKQYDELPQWYAAANTFVLPSITEQWGLVVNEAMAAGLPVSGLRKVWMCCRFSKTK